MKGRKMMQALSLINPKYIVEAEYDSLSDSGKAAAHTRRGPRLLLIAAIIAAMVFLMGAAVYTRWSHSLQRSYNPSESARQQAEKSGLSVMYEQTEPESGSILTATDQGITVSVVQSLVDKRMAQIVLKVEGFTPPQDMGIHPWVWWSDTRPTLGGDEHFWCSAGADFDNGTLYRDGVWVYEDGTPVEEKKDGYGWKGRYVKEDGSMELVMRFDFQDTSGANLGKELQLHFTGFGTMTNLGKADAAFEKLVEGNWNLKFVLNGSDNTIKASPNVRLSDNVTLLDVEIGQLTVKAQYKTDTYWDGWETLEFLSPALAGVKLKDGTLIRFSSATEGYQDQEKLLYHVDYRAYEGMVDMAQVEALAYYDHYENDADGRPTVPVYKYVPIS